MIQNSDSDEARRAYWREQTEAAYQFMQEMRTYPVEECGEKLASLVEAASDAHVKVVFSDTPIALDMPRVYFLREGLIPNFIAAAREMNARGWIMKVEDGFRSLTMQSQVSRRPLVFDQILQKTIWECGHQMPSPELMLRRLSVLTAVRPKVGTHMSGSAIDISVLRRDDEEEVDRGGPYLEMSEKTPMTSPFVSDEAQRNRLEIKELMERNGFVAYPWEFWHYNSGDCYAESLLGTGKPGRYGAIHFNPEDGTVVPVDDPDELLQPEEIIAREIENALSRLR